jgi:SAM-dependent methyltransferase
VSGEVGSCASCGRPATQAPLCGDCDALARSSYVHVSGEGQGRYDAELFTSLERLEPKSFWFRSRNRLIVWAMRSYFVDLTRFLEVGCGTGFVLAAIREALPHLQVMGSELYTEGLDVARRRLPEVPLVQMDALDVPFVGAFGAVGAFDVIEHIEEDEAVLRELGRAVPPGGGLLVTVPQHPRLWSAADDFAGHVRRYTRRELVNKAGKTGWEPVLVTSFMVLPLPFFALSRALGARSGKMYELERELRLPTSVDRSLEALMWGERALVTRGVSFPVGASLLLVARRTR